MSLSLSSFSGIKARMAEKILICLFSTINRRQVEFRAVGLKHWCGRLMHGVYSGFQLTLAGNDIWSAATCRRFSSSQAESGDQSPHSIGDTQLKSALDEQGDAPRAERQREKL